ncbi:MAG: integrase, partial [Chloroflexi bacterium]
AFIGAFLDHLERERANSVRTRNSRLAAIHSLFRFAALRHPEHAALIQLVLAVPPKRFDRAVVSFLTHQEVDALLAAPDRTRWVGRRDHALLVIAVQTGLRVSELIGLACADVHLRSGAHLRCVGKGRICGIRHMRPYVAPRTMSRRRSERPPLGGDRACWLDIFRSGQRLSRNASRGSGGR